MKKSVTISLEAETLAAAIARAAAVGLTLDAWVESLIVQRMRAATQLHIVESNAEAIAAMKEARRGNFETVTLDDLQCALDDTDPLEATPAISRTYSHLRSPLSAAPEAQPQGDVEAPSRS